MAARRPRGAGQAVPERTLIGPALLLAGPTASGKTALALEIARRLPVEVISVDSAQVYRGMDIGTAKPDAAQRAAVVHHLIDIRRPDESYSAAAFRTDALEATEAIRARGRMPLFVGGTMLYFKALREGLSELPSSDPTVRLRIDAEAARRGWPALHADLRRVDAATAQRLQPNDAQRIQRALEIHELTGMPMSRLLRARAAGELPFRPIMIALVPGDRALLHRRIAERFESMLRNGLLAELEQLRAQYPLRPDMPSMRCVGYRQAWQVLEGALRAEDLGERGIHATRQLAKRQLTWLRAMQVDAVFDCFEPGLAPQVLERIEHAIAR